MGQSTADEIDRLLQEGLNHYGTGDMEQAIRCWRGVLELDPSQPEAREYLEAALDDACEGNQGERAREPDALLQEAQRLLQADDPETALEILESAAAQDPDHLEVHSYIDMVRTRLLKRYRERFVQDPGIPRLRLEPEQVMKYNLPPDAGFLLSLVDGTITVKDLLSVCGMDEFCSLRLLARLVDAGIVEIGS